MKHLNKLSAMNYRLSGNSRRAKRKLAGQLSQKMFTVASFANASSKVTLNLLDYEHQFYSSE